MLHRFVYDALNKDWHFDGYCVPRTGIFSGSSRMMNSHYFASSHTMHSIVFKKRGPLLPSIII